MGYIHLIGRSFLQWVLILLLAPSWPLPPVTKFPQIIKSAMACIHKPEVPFLKVWGLSPQMPSLQIRMIHCIFLTNSDHH